MFFRDFRLPTSFTELFNYFLKDIKQKRCFLAYNMTEYFNEISNLVKFAQNYWFQMDFHTQKRVVRIFPEIEAYLLFKLYYLWNFQLI